MAYKKNKKVLDNKENNFNYIGRVVIPSKKEFKKDNFNSISKWGGLIPSYVKPLKQIETGVLTNKRPFASIFNENTNRSIFNSLIPRSQNEIRKKKLQGYNFSLGVPQDSLVIKNADHRFIGSTGTDIFKLNNEDPFGSLRQRQEHNVKAARYKKMAEIRWVDMVGNKKYKQYTANPFGDSDRDGVLNIFDCRPGNKWYRDEIADGPPLSQEEKAAAIAAEKNSRRSKASIVSIEAPKSKPFPLRGKRMVDGFENISFNESGTLYKGTKAGGRPRLSTSEATVRQLGDVVQGLGREFGKSAQRQRDSEEARIRQETKAKEFETKRQIAEIYAEARKQTAAEKARPKMTIAEARLLKEQRGQEKIKIQKTAEARRYLAEQIKAGVAPKVAQAEVYKRASQLSKQRTKEQKAREKLEKISQKAFSLKRKRMISGTQESLYTTALERQHEAKRAGIKARDLTLMIGDETRRLYNKEKIEKQIEKAKKKFGKDMSPQQKARITLLENKIAQNFGDVSKQSVENLKLKRQENLNRQKSETKRSEIIGGIYATKEGTKQKVYGGISKILGTDAGKVQRVVEDTSGLLKQAKKQFGVGFKTLSKKDMVKSKRYTGIARGAIGALTSFGGIGGVSGTAFGARGGSEVGGTAADYYGDSMSEADYAKNLKGAGRPEGTFKYGMPINEYKAMMREQTRAARIQEAVRQQAMTKQLSGQANIALGMGSAQTMTTDSVSGISTLGGGYQPIESNMGSMGATIGSGGDIINNISMRKRHSSEIIFPGLHAEAKIAKIPWLPTDPVMIRDSERPPIYFPDLNSAQTARDTQVFKVTELPRGSPMIGPVGFQYAGRIKEIKAPQTKSMIMQTQNDGIIKANPTMKANPWGLMIKNRLNFSESNIVDEDLRGNVISRDQIGGNILNTPNVFSQIDNRATGMIVMGQPNTIPSQSIGQYNPEVTGLGTLYAMQGKQPYQDYLSGNPSIASANPYRGTPQQQMMKQNIMQQKMIQSVNPRKRMSLEQTREVAIREQQRLSDEEEYLKQVAVQEGLKETDALGGKGFAKPSPIFETIKGLVMKKGPSDIEKKIIELQNRKDALTQDAKKEVEDITPGSPLPLNMMSNAKGNFEDLPVALKQQIIEEEIYQKQDEEMQRRYNIEQSKYQNELKEQMRQAAAIRNTQMDAAKRAQMAAEHMLSATGSDPKNKIMSSSPIQYDNGEILDPYYDENSNQQAQQIQTSDISQNDQNTNTYNGIKRKIKNNNYSDITDETGFLGHYPGSANPSDSTARGMNMGMGGTPYG